MKLNLRAQGQETPIPHQTLIMLSGGVESTSITKYLLELTDDPITAVFIYVPNGYGKAEEEKKALNLLVPRLQEIRPFKFFEITLKMPWQVIDVYWQIAMIPMLMKATNSVRMYQGLCAEDWEEEWRRREKVVYNIAMWMDMIPEEVAPNIPHLHLTKKQHMVYLDDLAPLTFSCQLPVKGQPCGKCKSCLMRNK
jgi:7-cyano-7-deazaguanine synthase in queuosine biosynthesis